MQLGQILDKRYKETKKPICHFLRAWNKKAESGAKAGYCTCPLARNTTEGVGRPPKPRLQPRPRDTPLPSPQVRNQLTTTSSEWGVGVEREASKQENLLIVLTRPCYSRDLNKALPEFLLWPLINFYCLRGPDTESGAWGQVLSGMMDFSHAGSSTGTGFSA